MYTNLALSLPQCREGAAVLVDGVALQRDNHVTAGGALFATPFL